jgi:hypothetical protein
LDQVTTTTYAAEAGLWAINFSDGVTMDLFLASMGTKPEQSVAQQIPLQPARRVR